jgi:hypothetical protein
MLASQRDPSKKADAGEKENENYATVLLTCVCCYFNYLSEKQVTYQVEHSPGNEHVNY